MITFYISMSLLFILICVIIIRTINFKENFQSHPKHKVKLDEAHAIESLKAMIKFKTISHVDPSKIDNVPFEMFIEYLMQRYKTVVKHAEIIRIEPMGLIFKIKGDAHEHPTVLMSHFDVVPENGLWEHDPFLGEIIEGYIYGRGTLDTKGTLCAVMESVEHHLKKLYTFKEDLYLCFSGDEEVYGKSAHNMVAYLDKHHIKPALVLDEGGAVVKDIFPNVKESIAVIGISEKGVLSLKLTASSSGGHAAMPPKDTPITQLSKAVVKLNQSKHFKLTLTESVYAMFDTVARYSKSFIIRMIFANLWVFSPLVKQMASRSGGELLSLMKTTQAFTMMEGSEAINVLPTKASVGINYRLLTNQTGEKTIQSIKKIINNDHIQVNTLYLSDPPSLSKRDLNYQKIVDTIYETFEETIPTPYLMMATTDSRHYHKISENVYRFSPMRLSKEGLKTIHGVNEKIHKDDFIECVKFYINLLKKL
ncbi:MAG: M20/M25/M40 family metallo-hydrolase [Candidatus Izemoplasmataceae bacterium]